MKRLLILIVFVVLYSCITIDETTISKERIYNIEYQQDTFDFIVIDSTIIWIDNPYNKKKKIN